MSTPPSPAGNKPDWSRSWHYRDSGQAKGFYGLDRPDGICPVTRNGVLFPPSRTVHKELSTLR